MCDIQILRKLVNEEAINYMIKNEKEFEAQYNSFLKSNRVVIGIDIGSGRDKTGYPGSK